MHVGPPHDIATAAITWDVARVEARLRDAGFTSVREGEDVRQPFMSAPGARLRIAIGASGHAEVQVFVYEELVARGRDTGRLDTVRVAPPTMMISWRVTPSLIVDNNLALIVLASDTTLRVRIRRAITGGP